MEDILKNPNKPQFSIFTNSGNSNEAKYLIKYGRSTLQELVKKISMGGHGYFQMSSFSDKGQFSLPGNPNIYITKAEYEEIKSEAIEFNNFFNNNPNLKYIIIDRYKTFIVYYYTFTNKTSYNIIILHKDIKLIERVLLENKIQSEINGKFLLIRDVTPEIQF